MKITSSLIRGGVAAGLLVTGLVAVPTATTAATPASSAGPSAASGSPLALPRPARIELQAGFRPEGITSSPGGRFYVGSLAAGAIYAGSLRTGQGTVITSPVTGRSLRGLYYDKRTNLVWAAGQDGTTGIVLAVNAITGDQRHRIEVPGAAFLNDLVVTEGAVWVTDSAADRLTRVPLDSRGFWNGFAPTFAALGGAWPTTGDFRANGIRALPDGSLLVNHSTAGGLWRFVPRTGVVAPITVTGSPAIVSGDGMELVGRTLYVVRGSGGGVTVATLSRSGGAWTADVVGELVNDKLDVPSTATVALGRVWAVNARFGVAEPEFAPYWVTRLPLMPRD